MEKFSFFLIILFLSSSVSAYTVICSDGIRGAQIWNLNQTFNETGWILEDIGDEEELDCTLVETSVTLREDCKEFEPIINQLNQRLADNYREIEEINKKVVRYKYYKWSAFIFVVVSIILVIFLRLNAKEGKNGEKTSKTR